MWLVQLPRHSTIGVDKKDNPRNINSGDHVQYLIAFYLFSICKLIVLPKNARAFTPFTYCIKR